MKKFNLKSGKVITFLTAIGLIFFLGFSQVSTSSTQPNLTTISSHHNKATDWKKSIVQVHVKVGDQGYAAGTGWVLSQDGIIITNFHVVEHDTNQITVVFADGSSTPAKFVGGDKDGDVAVIKVETTHELIPLALGNSSKLEVGDQLTIIGNPLDQGITVTRGIVANPSVYFPEFPFAYVETDATINPGNSGGVMLDSEGRFVAMTALLAPGSNGGNAFGFGISVNDIEWSLVKIAKHLDLTRVKLGIKIKDSTAFDSSTNLTSPNGVTVDDSVNPMLMKNDLITKINGATVNDSSDIHAILGKILVGENVVVTVVRSGKTMEIHLEGKVLTFPQPKVDTVVVPAPTVPKSLPPTPDAPKQKSK